VSKLTPVALAAGAAPPPPALATAANE
jgi:hypothetical protein